MAKTQCPNCGGYRAISMGEFYTSEMTGEVVEVPPANYGLLGVLGLLSISTWILIVFLGGTILQSVQDSANFEENRNPIIAISIILPLMMIAVALLRMRFQHSLRRREEARRDTIRRTRYECELCGYEFDDRPAPTNADVQVDSDLIRRGHRHLEDLED